MDPPDPVEAINYRMEQQGLTYRDLEEIVSTRTRIAEVLSRKRELSIATIHRMHERLGISAKVLIRPGARACASHCGTPTCSTARAPKARCSWSRS